MISMDYMHWHKTFKSLILFTALLSACSLWTGCSLINSLLGRESLPEEDELTIDETTKLEGNTLRAISTQFEWAVQYYEAGQYEQALASFSSLEKEGASVPSFELIPFYQGMSFMQLNKPEKAIPYLESFIKNNAKLAKAQEARMALLICFESTKNWTALSAMASEIEKFSLYTENRTLLHLLWAEALLEQNELLGAKKNLAVAASLMNNMPVHSDSYLSAELNRSNEDLYGRYIWTNARFNVLECTRLKPQEQSKKSKNKKHFFEIWIQAKSDCLQKTMLETLNVYQSLSPRWAENTVKIYTQACNDFIKTPQWLVENKYISNQKEAKQMLKNKLRISFYNFSSLWGGFLKNFQYQTLNRDYLEKIIKHIESLIYELSLPSS